MAEAILITAAGRRIGRCLAETLAAEGYYIYLHYRTSRDDAEATLARIRARGGDGELLSCNLENYDEAETLAARCQTPGHPLRHVINNASLFREDSVFDFTEESFAAHQHVNLRAPLQLSRALHRLIPDGARGSVVNILDSKVFALNPDFHSYSLSKFGLLGATETTAQALSPRVRVNAIAPGLTLISHTQSAESFRFASHLNFIGEPLRVEDIARTALLLISSPSLNGATIPVDGGQKMINFTGDVVNIAQDIAAEAGTMDQKPD